MWGCALTRCRRWRRIGPGQREFVGPWNRQRFWSGPLDFARRAGVCAGVGGALRARVDDLEAQ